MKPPQYMSDAVGVLPSSLRPSIFTTWPKLAPAIAKSKNHPTVLNTSSPNRGQLMVKNQDALLQGWNIAKLAGQFNLNSYLLGRYTHYRSTLPNRILALHRVGLGAYDACFVK